MATVRIYGEIIKGAKKCLKRNNRNFRTVPKYPIEKLKNDAKIILLTINRLLSWLGTSTSIKSGRG